MGFMSPATGTFVNPGRGFLQSAGFVLDPAGKVAVSAYPAPRSAAWYPTTWWCWSATGPSTATG